MSKEHILLCDLNVEKIQSFASLQNLSKTLETQFVGSVNWVRSRVECSWSLTALLRNIPSKLNLRVNLPLEADLYWSGEVAESLHLQAIT